MRTNTSTKKFFRRKKKSGVRAPLFCHSLFGNRLCARIELVALVVGKTDELRIARHDAALRFLDELAEHLDFRNILDFRIRFNGRNRILGVESLEEECLDRMTDSKTRFIREAGATESDRVRSGDEVEITAPGPTWQCPLRAVWFEIVTRSESMQSCAMCTNA